MRRYLGRLLGLCWGIAKPAVAPRQGLVIDGDVVAGCARAEEIFEIIGVSEGLREPLVPGDGADAEEASFIVVVVEEEGFFLMRLLPKERVP
jgi:hypothetical protein